MVCVHKKKFLKKKPNSIFILLQACTKSYQGGDAVTEKKLITIKKGISLNYLHHWIVDNMPVTWCYILENSKQYCSTGFPIGCLVRKDDTCPISIENSRVGNYYIFNHVDLVITYHSGDSEEWGASFGSKGGRSVINYYQLLI